MKIVVIGGSGLIGKKVATNLRQGGQEVGDHPRLGPTRFADWLSRNA